MHDILWDLLYCWLRR